MNYDKILIKLLSSHWNVVDFDVKQVKKQNTHHTFSHNM